MTIKNFQTLEESLISIGCPKTNQKESYEGESTKKSV
jgi:hypothetical protein